MREPNPAMGWRAVRMGLDRPGLLRYQLRALVRAGVDRELSILIPLITSPAEFAAVRAMLDQELDYAERHGRGRPATVQLGFMLETPAVAFSPDECLSMADFVSLGANDLMQYFFAADRQNPKVSERFDPVSPAALRLFTHIREACDRHGKPINVCGELGGRPLEACVLAALGYRTLSMAAGSIGPVKRALAGCDLSKLGAALKAEMARPEGPQTAPLRARLLALGENSGLPPECVDKIKSI
jgi:phosphotransferase system enzyme I (PtsP)